MLVAVAWLAAVGVTQPWPEADTLIVDGMEGRVHARWAGAGMAVVGEAKEGAQALRWEVEGSIASSRIPHDWSELDRLVMWMHSEAAGNAVIALVLTSDRDDTPPEDYFITHIPIDWEGWRKLELPFRAFRRVGTPAGFGKIDSIAFHASGWETVQRPGTILTIDATTLRGSARGEDLIVSDMEEDIAGWDGLTPDPLVVKEGQQSGAWLDTMPQLGVQCEQIPEDWSDYDYLCFWMHCAVVNGAQITVLVSSENPETEGEDYWRARLFMDWEGWRHIAIPLAGMWATREPVGWDHVTRLRLSSHWGAEPKPDTQVRIDDVRLTRTPPAGAGPELGVIDDFEGPLWLWETEMTRESESARSGRSCGRWTDVSMKPARRLARPAVRNWATFEALQFWARTDSPRPAHLHVRVHSENDQTAKSDYWRCGDLEVRAGAWHQFTVPLARMVQIGAPRGWEDVEALEFAASEATVNARAQIWIDDVGLVAPALELVDAGIRRIGPNRLAWDLMVRNRGDEEAQVRTEVQADHARGLALSLLRPAPALIGAGVQESITVEATLTDDVLRAPRQLSGRRAAVSVAHADGTDECKVISPALAFYFGCLEPAAHPRLFYSQDDLPALRQKLKSGALAASWDSYLQEHDPTEVGSGSGYSLRWGLDAAALLYQLTGDEPYRTAAHERLRRLLSQHSGPDARETELADLYSALTARVLGAAYDWLYPELDVEERTACRAVMAEAGVQPLLKALDGGAWYAEAYDRNYCGILHGGVGVAALAVLGDEPMAPRWIARMYEQIERMLELGPEDGGWTESPNYWEYGFSFAFEFMDALRRATGGAIDLFEHPYCQQTGAFGLYTRLSDFDAVTFGDSRRRQYDRSVLVKLAAELGSPELQWAALNRESALRHPFSFIWYDPDVLPQPPTDWPLSKHFRGIDWVFLRTGWGPDATVFALRSGRRDAHSHLDANSFILEAFGQPMLVDVGTGSYGSGYFDKESRWDDAATRTESHSTILINGANQIPGEDGGHIAKFSTSEDFDYTLADAASTYEGAEKVLRHVLFVRPAYFLIHDEVETQEAAEVAFSLYKDSDDTRRELADGSVVYDWERASLLVKVLQPAGASFEPAGEVKRHRCDRLTHPEQARTCDFLVLLYPLPAGEGRPLPSVSTRREGADIVVDVKRPGATDT
ncbi:MAG: heparinase II/III family protein, partial [Armatimonadota bacterium]